jgi:hypothetical protein
MQMRRPDLGPSTVRGVMGPHRPTRDPAALRVLRGPRRGPARYWYWDDVASRRLRPDQLTREEALEQTKVYARAMRDRL